MKYTYYVEPPIDVYLSVEKKGYIPSDYLWQTDGKSYTRHNYLTPGIVSYIKTRHFETALNLTRDYFYDYNVIDFGCADGAFIPSLSKYFNHVVGIDNKASHVKASSKLIHTKHLKNVELICNSRLTVDGIQSKLSGKKYHILYLLETLEHIGKKNRLYESKLDFLKDISRLLVDDGIIVITVPNMIGLSYLVQHLVAKPFGTDQRTMSLKNLFRACFLKDTTELEHQWNHGHIGFNHKKLEQSFEHEFEIVKKKNMICQIAYVIKKYNAQDFKNTKGVE